MMRLEQAPNGTRCLTCGSHVTPQFRRGYGDENDRAHRCPTCDNYERLAEGSAAGQHVPLPDPLEDPSRFNSTLEDLPTQVRSVIESRAVATDGGEDRE
ncbi:hypothetical protein D8Y22_12715 [Salinadaptatus halalkaliphilus]|uniref:Small CPxCG-related zinc finger protein n=1 Tax=Salinadaptatus halalkaliphilus TaxID=2419781 RepID=A0A4S3TK55_9EURY|nr:hypothetical protein [Salinadaptatus halalkaliphilus]THE64499.1 hypothetical protein D8Y22_12715 [Salinadaptatus halalkaliphilus]